MVLHAASYVEVVPEGPVGDAGGDEDDEDDDGIPTLMLQMDAQLFDDEGVSLVQRDASEIAGVLGRLQDALSGPDAGVSRLRAAHLRGRVHRLRLNNFVEAQVSDQVEALCVVTEAVGELEPARGYQALEAQVAEWSWSWWRLLEPMLLNQPDDPPNAQETCAVSSSGNGSLQVVSQEQQQNEVDVALLAADQEDERRHTAALQHQQALFEQEEELYYRGVEAAVEAELSAQAAREAKAWDDWALHDEMYAGVRSRKRLCLEVTVGPTSGQPGAQQTVRVPMVPGHDQEARLRVGTMPVEVSETGDEPVPSEVSTDKPAAVHMDGPPPQGSVVEQEEIV